MSHRPKNQVEELPIAKAEILQTLPEPVDQG